MEFDLGKRIKIFITFSTIIFLLIIARMLLLAGSGGQAWRQEAAAISVKTGELTAIRGRIYAGNGELLAWSERCYDLYWHTPAEDHKRQQAIAGELQKNFEFSGIVPGNERAAYPIAVKYNLTANELEIADSLSESYPELTVELRWERRRAENTVNPGEVRQLNGMEQGISGLELTFDRRLRSTPGKFTVMLDRHGKWINSTFRIIEPPRRGNDVYLSEEPEGCSDL